MPPPPMSVGLHAVSFAKLVLAIAVLYLPLKIVYNLFLHPLRRYPGPLLHRATYGPYCRKLARGTLARDMRAIHDKYGPVVRIAPDQLSFIDAEAWKDVYGHRTGAHAGLEEMGKAKRFYRTKGMVPSIVAEDRENHAIMRRHMSHGFSERAMRQQEPIIGSYVDLLVRRLREHHRKPETGELVPVNLKSWYNWTTFDIIGDLAFGEPFDCLENSAYHPWVAIINDMIPEFATMAAMKWAGLEWVVHLVRNWGFGPTKLRDKHITQTREKLDRRMALTMDRPDLIEGLLQLKGLSTDKIRVNASTLIIAGSETTATLLSGVTYLLLSNPDKMERLKQEVRSSFEEESQITLLSVNKLSYMLACLDEALRRYPPVPIGMPRSVPKGGAKILGQYVPENTVVAVWQFAAYTSERNFSDPLAFKPERFLGGQDSDSDAVAHEKKAARDNFDVFQPFSFGPRNCIGKNLAYAEMRLILAKVLFNFDMELVDKNLDWLDQAAYVLWDKPPLDVYLTPVRR